ncbi:MAG: right-handed parallel beta-helix repeat-containing protein, partial [Phycisphaerales bacterium]|nr:right-handed parallel beta-helix repeat-containing protein [Phycisphaerales bacterium]
MNQKRMKLLPALLVLCLLATSEFFVQPVISTTTTVSNADELSRALEIAQSGDIILLNSAATFTPTAPLVGFGLRNVVVNGTGPGLATIDCSQVQGDFCLRLSNARQLTLANVQLQRFGVDGGLFVQASSQVTISNVTVSQGHGLSLPSFSVESSNQVAMNWVSVIDNVNDESAAGIQLVACTSCTISNSTFSNNEAVVFAGLSVFQSTLKIVNSVMQGNRGMANCEIQGSKVDVTNSTFSGNSGASSTLCAVWRSTVRFISCSFHDNFGIGADDVASLFNILSSNVTFQCSNVSGNVGAVPGAAASLINFVGAGPVYWPTGVTCFNGQLYYQGSALNIACYSSPPSTLQLIGSVFFAEEDSGAPAIRVEMANVVAVGVQLSARTGLLLANSSVADFTSADNRISGAIQCNSAVKAAWGDKVCGNVPCACGAVATANASLHTEPAPLLCTSLPDSSGDSVVVVATGDGVVIVSGPTGTEVTPVDNPLPGSPIISPTVSITVNGTGGPVGPVSITLPYNCSDHHFCLAYFNVNKSKWECVDKCLSLSKQGATCYATGDTPHLTSFALLLSGDEDACGREDSFYQWAAIAALAAAAVLCLLIVILFGYV